MLGLNVRELLRDVGLDAGALFVLVYLVYFRRHRRWDQLVGLVAFNVCLFTVSAALGASGPVNVGVGFGLFAVLSIVRLRSEEASQVEIGYTMVALVLGLMAGLPGMDFPLKGIFAAFLIATMFLVDNQRLDQASRYTKVRVELDRVIHDDQALALHLEQTLNRPILATQVREIDFVRETMRLDVQTGPRKS
ncbi:MAG: DUF4956 domain-containing protein [Actinomycetia bacterium]|nr:DUF4956 domain-containing protein [Actinomycetes bacterium]